MSRKNKSGGVLKWIGMALGGLLVVIIAVVGFFYVSSSRMINRVYAASANDRPLYVPADSATLARGKHLTDVVLGCAECHSPNYGGLKVFDDPAFGRLFAPNLTPGKGSVMKSMDIVAFEKVIRHGIRHDGTAIWFMPSNHYCYIADDDLAAVFAYLQQLPPVDGEYPERDLGPVGRMLLSRGKLPLQPATMINQEAKRPPKPAEGVTVAYGEYLARVSCIGCHAPNMAGGTIHGAPPEWPPAANLTRGGIAATYTEQDFIRAMREGKRPTGDTLSPVMPWRIMGRMTDDELKALWAYLQSIPASPFGSGDWASVRVP